MPLYHSLTPGLRDHQQRRLGGSAPFTAVGAEGRKNGGYKVSFYRGLAVGNEWA